MIKKLMLGILVGTMMLGTVTPAMAAENENVTHESIKLAQEYLNELGYDCGNADGIAGEKTEIAVKSYQEENGLEVTGSITDDLLKSLQSNITSIQEANNSQETETETEAVNDGSISFRNIPWGTTYNGFFNKYNEFGINKDYDPYISEFISMPNDKETKIEIYSNAYSVPDGKKAGFDISKYEESLCTVGGYAVVRIEYGFVFSTDKSSGYVDESIDAAKLYSGAYSFESMTDSTAMVEDLTNKLSSIYGEVKNTNTTSYTNGDTHNDYLWEDENGDWVILRHVHNDNEPDSVFLSYYTEQIFDWTKQLTDAYLKEESENFVAPSGNEGL